MAIKNTFTLLCVSDNKHYKPALYVKMKKLTHIHTTVTTRNVTQIITKVVAL